MASEPSKKRDADLSLKLFVVLTRALEAIKKKVEADIRELGLNTTEFAVMELLYHKGNQPIQKIGKKVLIASSSITYVVDKLEEKQYIKRIPCPDDRRVTYASLTKEGAQLMDEVFPQHRCAIQEICAGLTTEEKEVVIDLLKKLGYYAQGL